MKRKAAEIEAPAPAPVVHAATQPAPHVATTAHGLAAEIAQYGEDLEGRYLAARDAWLKAMQAANSGRSADLAKLAIAQEAYEAVATEREQWLEGGRIAVPVHQQSDRHDVEIAVEQSLAWREILQHQPRRGLSARIGRLFRRR